MLAALFILALGASAGEAAIEPITKIGAILKNRDLANGKWFCVVGVPTITESKIGRVTGKHLFRGRLDDGTGTLEMFAFGHFPKVASGNA